MRLAILVILPLSFTVIIITYIVLRQTILDISYPGRNPWPLFLYLEIFLILVPINIVSVVGIENVTIIYIKAKDIDLIASILVLSTLLVLILFLSILLRTFNLHINIVQSPNDFSHPVFERIDKFALSLTLLGFILLFIFWFFNYKHAFISSLLTNQSLIVARLKNKYYSRVPSQLSAILFVTGYLLFGSSGFISKRFYKKSILYFVAALLFVSASGDKAPILKGFIIWLFSNGSFLPQRLWSFKYILVSILNIFLLFSLLYFVVSLQIPDLTVYSYFIYLFNRIGVGQMAGVFETLGLASTEMLPSGKFYWHLVPGARIFVDYVDYQKALMMVVEGYEYTQMGVKNTYFIAEAYAIGGVVFALFSSIIVAFSLSFSLLILIKLFRRILSREIGPHFALLVWTQSFSLTGGFASFPLFKGLILILLYLIPIIVLYVLFCRIKRS